MKTFQQKKIQRKIAKASRRGRYLVSRRGRRDRPGRKGKGIKCNNCGNTLAKYHNYGLCDNCLDKNENKIMHIPKMTKK